MESKFILSYLKICHLVINTMSNMKVKLLNQNSLKENYGREVTLLLSDEALTVPRHIMDINFVKELCESSEVCCSTIIQLPQFRKNITTNIMELMTYGENAITGKKERRDLIKL